MTDKNQHSMLSASKAHRWLVCTPSARLELEEETQECSVYAAEGTAAHELAELKLSHKFGKIPEEVYNEKYKFFVDNCEFYNKGFEEFVDEFVDYVIELTKDLKEYSVLLETRVSFSNVVPQGEGTADVIILTKDKAYVIDLKFGIGVPVTAINNPQLRLYAIGVLNMFPGTKEITTVIHMPRLGSVDSETLAREELLKWGIEYVAPLAELAAKGEGVITPDEDACRFCKLKGKCKGRADAQLAIAKREFSITSKSVQELTTEQISKILDVGPQFIKWLKDVEAYALGQLAQGVSIPGYKLVEGRSNRIMTQPEKIKQKLIDIGFPEDMVMKPREMLGISALEKLVGKKLFASLFDDYLEKPAGKLTLAPVSDKRPEINSLYIAQQDFND